MALYGWYSSHPEEIAAIPHAKEPSISSDNPTVREAVAQSPRIADRALPGFVDSHFPPGLRGLFLAALMAAIMSSIDSGIHSVTTALVVDFRDRLAPQWRPTSERREIRMIRVLIVVIGAISIAIACLVDPESSVFSVSRKLTAAFGGPLLAIFVLAFFSTRATWQAVLVSASISTIATLALMTVRSEWFSPGFWPIGFGMTIVGGYACSLLQRPIPTDYTFSSIM